MPTAAPMRHEVSAEPKTAGGEICDFLVDRREHPPGGFSAHRRGIVRGEPSLRNLAVEVRELSAEYRRGGFALIRAPWGRP